MMINDDDDWHMMIMLMMMMINDDDDWHMMIMLMMLTKMVKMLIMMVIS